MAQNKTIQRQIMEAGVAEMFESYGFSKVSATLYKKEEDFGIWYTALTPGIPKEGGKESFRDITGFYTKGLDDIADLYKRTFPESGRDDSMRHIPLKGTRARARYQASVLGELSRQSPGRQYYPVWQEWLDGIRNRIPPLRKYTVPFFEYCPDVIVPHRTALWRIGTDRTVSDFVDDYCEYWPRAFAEQTEPGWYPRTQVLRFSPRDNWALHERRVACHWLLGAMDRIYAAAEELEADLNHSPEQLAEMIADRFIMEKRAYGSSKDEIMVSALEDIPGIKKQFEKSKRFIQVLENFELPR